MDAIRGDVRKLVNKELNAANKRFRPLPARTRGRTSSGKSWKKLNRHLCRWNSTSKRECGTPSRQTKQFRGKNFKKSVKWLSVWQWKRFR